MAIRRVPEPICQGYQVTELGKFSFNINYRGKSRSAILIRFNGAVYGYLNQCVHMPRALDCEDSNIFDESGRYLQCSMHSICYDPVSGQSLSEICAGKKLTALKVREEGSWVYLLDKRAIMETKLI
ncbi:MAG TPA: (2Fe-2S)-binding protein [Methylococcaceae bacterium]|nr:(2Fe-2S)-binding protein [Methylococcaceae bacterium]